MDYYRTAPVPVLQLCSTMAIVPVAPSVPNQVQDRLSAVGLVMQAKTLALKSCSANQRWCKIITKTTVCTSMDSTSRNGVRGGRGHCRSDDAVYNCLAARLPGNFTTLSAQMRCFIWPLLTARVVRRLPSSLATRMPIPFQNVSRGPSNYTRVRVYEFSSHCVLCTWVESQDLRLRLSYYPSEVTWASNKYTRQTMGGGGPIRS